MAVSHGHQGLAGATETNAQSFFPQKGNPPVAGASGVGLPEGRRDFVFPGGKWACEYQVGLISWGPHRQI